MRAENGQISLFQLLPGDLAMDSADIDHAADLLWRHWRDDGHIETLPQSCRPTTIEDGYAIQARVAERNPQPVAGWKIAATSAAGQAHIGVDGPLSGRLYADRILFGPASVPFADNRMAVAEAEFAFELGTDLPARASDYGHDEVLAAVRCLRTAIELPDSRFVDFVAAGAPQLVADNACARWFVAGAVVDDHWRSLDLASCHVTLSINGRVATSGSGADVLGDPRDALTWLVNDHRRRGRDLKTGDLVTTGVCGRPSPIAPGDRVLARFDGFGEVEVTLL
jgi:2-keto-4-pentenoate hydratase